MDSLTQRLRQSSFIRHNAIFFVGSLLIGVCNYMYYPLLGRLLEPASFGEVQTLISLFLQITTFLSVLGLLAVNIVANHDDAKQRNLIVLELEKLALLIGGLLLLLTIALGPVLRDFFQFDSALPFTLLALAVLATVPFTFRTSYLRGKHYFGLNSIAGMVGAAGKLLLSGVLVVIGFRTAGAIFGVVLAQVLAFVYAGYYARKHGYGESLRTHWGKLPNFAVIRPELRYSLVVLATSLSITVLYSVDIVVVKHFFDATTAGLYASIATVSRVLFFLTASISQVLMPSVRLQNTPQQNRQLLYKSLALVSVVGGGALAVFWATPRFFVELLMGPAYVQYANLLPQLSLAMFVVSILNLLLTYYMALRQYLLGVIGLLGAFSIGIAMWNLHHNLEQVVHVLLYGSLLTSLVVVLWGISSKQSVLTQKGGNV